MPTTLCATCLEAIAQPGSPRCANCNPTRPRPKQRHDKQAADPPAADLTDALMGVLDALSRR